MVKQEEHDKVQEELKSVKKELREERKARRDITDELSSVSARQINGFIDFIREKGVVGLAVGVAFGTAATQFVNQIVKSVITPTVGLLLGENGLSKFNTKIGNQNFLFGDLLDAFLRFLAVAFVIYIVVKILRLDRLDKKPEDKS